MIPRKNKIYHFEELVDDAQCRKCKNPLEWCCCEPSQGLEFEAFCCLDHHYIKFAYNDGFELKGKYERERIPYKA